MDDAMRCRERGFTVELGSRGGLKNVTLANGPGDSALVEGTIGELVRAAFAEGMVLEVVGTGGTVRIDLREGEIKKAVDRPGVAP